MKKELQIVDSLTLAAQIRKEALGMVYRAKASHIAGAFSCADIMSVLYNEVLRYDVSNPKWDERDLFFFSKGHACTALYATLALKGFFPVSDLNKYAEDDSLMLSHVSHYISGVELSAGSLGLTLSHAIGCALAKMRKHQASRIYCLLSDGELDEGSNWEGFLFAPHHKLENLTVIIDYNKIQSLDRVGNVIDLNPLDKKFESFGWHVIVIDGHAIDQIRNAFEEVNKINNKPCVVIANTIKGKGVDFMEDSVLWHYKSPNDEQYNAAMVQLNKIR